MSLFPSILLPLDGSETAARGIGCASWLAAEMHARLHILTADSGRLPPDEALRRLRVPERHWRLVSLHQVHGRPEDAIVDTVMHHAVRLLVITARGETADALGAGEAPEPVQLVGHVTRAVIEQSPVPVLLLPPSYEEALPWRSVLVPVSGEAVAEQSLTLAVRLAGELGLEVNVAHVADPAAGEGGIAAIARYPDAPHHEYPRLLEEFVSRALPGCPPEDCRRIREVSLCLGDVAAEVLKLAGKRASLLAVGWHGRFMTGHAQVLKVILQAITCPVLMVKPAGRMPFRLKVGPDFE